MATQILLNKNKVKEEGKPIGKEKRKEEVEKALESIRRFNQLNEQIKESYDKQVEKSKNEKMICVSQCKRLKQTTFQIKNHLDSDSDSSKD